MSANGWLQFFVYSIVLLLTVKPAGCQLGVGGDAFAQIRLKRDDLVGAGWPRLVSRRFEASFDVAADGLAIQPRLPGDG